MEVTVVCNLIRPVTFLHLCCISWVRSKFQVLSTYKGHATVLTTVDQAYRRKTSPKQSIIHRGMEGTMRCFRSGTGTV